MNSLNGKTLIKDNNGTLVRDKEQRTVETKEQSNDSQSVTSTKIQQKQEQAVDRYAMEVCADALYANAGGKIGTGEDEINALLKDKTEAEKQVMDEIYRQKYGVGLEEELKRELSGSELEKKSIFVAEKRWRVQMMQAGCAQVSSS